MPTRRTTSSPTDTAPTNSAGPRKTFVLDTSVLIAGGKQALYAFDEHQVVIPLVVVTELEAKRNDPELGWVSRQVLRELEALRLQAEADNGSLADGVVVNDLGGTVRIELNHIDQSDLPRSLRDERSNDMRIVAVAQSLLAADRDAVVLVSRDLPMRLLAGGALGMATEDYRHDQAADDGYTGIAEYVVDGTAIDSLFESRDVTAESLGIDEPVNTGLVLRTTSSQSALAVVDSTGVVLKTPNDQTAFGLKPHSAEQRIALGHLLDPNVKVVSLGGRAGTGKSTLALAAGLELAMERREHKKVIVFRPMYAVGGQDLGYLPGSESEKMGPWAQAVYDALGMLGSKAVLDDIASREMLEVLPLTHIRGRSLHDAFVIVDEAQQLERNTLLTVLSRIGQNAKVVLTHDVAQRDNLHVGRHDGIAAVIELLKGEPLFAHTTLVRSERSEVAELVTRLLDGAS